MRVIDHWLERWVSWEDRRRRAKSLSYSIRRCHPDEIEVRPSVNDGLTRGFFRVTLFCGMLVIFIVDHRYGVTPSESVSNTIKSFQRDFEWVFNPDKELRPMYEHYEEVRIRAIENDEFLKLEKKHMRNTKPLISNALNGQNSNSSPTPYWL